jgi:hypothetical protein
MFEDGTISSLDELAHIIAESDKGPRGKSKLPSTQRDEYENIILLCPTCHTIIDKNPAQYPPDTLTQWKKQHEEKINKLFSTPKYPDRVSLSIELHKLLQINNAVFREYGPHSSNAVHPLTDATKMWRKHIMQDILPNNRKIWAILDYNRELLMPQEIEIACKFKLHYEAFEYNQISGDKISSAPLFPQEMNSILKEDL